MRFLNFTELLNVNHIEEVLIHFDFMEKCCGQTWLILFLYCYHVSGGTANQKKKKNNNNNDDNGN